MGRLTDAIGILGLAGLWVIVPRFFSFNWLLENSLEEQSSGRVRCWNYLKEFLEGVFMAIAVCFPWRMFHGIFYDSVMAALLIVVGVVTVATVLWRVARPRKANSASR